MVTINSETTLPQLEPNEIEECKRQWNEDRAAAQETLRSEGRPAETLEDWLAYCNWCCEEYGMSPFDC